jgi:hypothetical protein
MATWLVIWYDYGCTVMVCTFQYFRSNLIWASQEFFFLNFHLESHLYENHFLYTFIFQQLFFLEHAWELRIIVLIEEEKSKIDLHTPHTQDSLQHNRGRGPKLTPTQTPIPTPAGQTMTHGARTWPSFQSGQKQSEGGTKSLTYLLNLSSPHPLDSEQGKAFCSSRTPHLGFILC